MALILLYNLGSPLLLAVSTLIAICFVNLLVQSIRNVFFHPLLSFPGPKSWAATSIPFVWSQVRGNEVFDLLELHRIYGDVVRIAPNELSYSTSVVWKDAFAHRQGHEEFSKHAFSKGYPVNGVYGILPADRADHSRFRRLLSASFSEKGMRAQQPTIQHHVDLLMQRLRENADKGPQNMVKWFNWTTFDIIGALAFGESFNCLADQKMHPWIAAIFGNISSVPQAAALQRYGLLWTLPYLAPKEATRLRLYNYQYSSKKIEERVQRGNDQGDFWDNVLKHNTDEGGMTMEEMKSNASNIVLAGSETTATLLSGCLYMLLKHPEAMKKTVSEIRQAFTSPDDIDLFTVSNLHYCLAVLNETMRIYPPVPSQANRTVPAGGDTIEGKRLPEGTVIHISQYVANHLESNFQKPFEFIPERFLGDETFKNDNYSVMQPFSVGPRNCIGRNLAYAEMRLIMAKLLYSFDFELLPSTKEWTDQKTYVLWEKNPLWVKVTPVQKE